MPSSTIMRRVLSSSSLSRIILLFLLLLLLSFTTILPTIVSATMYFLPVGSQLGQVGNMIYDASRDTIIIGSYSKRSMWEWNLNQNRLNHLAGSSIGSSGSNDNTNGPSARFTYPMGVIVVYPKNSKTVSTGYIISDFDNHCLRHMASTSPFGVTTAAGLCGSGGNADGTGTNARCFQPRGISWLAKSRKIFVGQEGSGSLGRCTKVAAPVTQNADGYTSLIVSRNAGYCNSAGSTINSNDPMLSFFTQPYYTQGTIKDVGYILESNGNLFRMFPADGSAGARIVKLSTTIPKSGGHFDCFSLQPGFGAVPFLFIVPVHNSGSTVYIQVATATEDDILNEAWEPTFTKDSCAENKDAGASVLLPNGTVVISTWETSDSLFSFTGSSCERPERPKAAFYYLDTDTPTISKTLVSYTATLTATRTSTVTFTDSISKSLTPLPTPSSSLPVTESLTVSANTPSSTRSPSSSKSSSPSATGETSSRTFPLTISRSPSISENSETSTFSKERTTSSSRSDATDSHTIDPTFTPTDDGTVTPSDVFTFSESDNVSTDSISLSVLESDSITHVNTETISLPVPPTPPRKKPEGVLGGSTALTTLAIISALTGNAGLAVATVKLEAALTLSQCGTGRGIYEEMGYLENPLWISFGDQPLAWQRGAAFGSIWVLIIFSALVMIAAFIMSLVTERTFMQSLKRLRMPGLVSLPLFILQPGAAEASAALWMYSNQFNDWSLAVFSLVTMIAGPMVLMALITLPGYCKATLYKITHEDINNNSKSNGTTEDDNDNNKNKQGSNEEKDSNEDDDDDHENDVRRGRGEGGKRRNSSFNNDTIHDDERLLEEPLMIDENISEELEKNNTNDNNNKSVDSSSFNESEGLDGKKNNKETPPPAAAVVDDNSCMAKMRRFWVYLVVADFEWYDHSKAPPTVPRVNQVTKGDEDERGAWTAAYGAAFEDFDRAHIVLYDVWTNVYLGFCAGVSGGIMSRSACLMWLSSCLCFSLAMLYYFIRWRPFLTRIRKFFMIFSALVTTLTIFLATLQFLSSATQMFDSFSTTILDVQTIVGLLTAIVELLTLFVLFVELYDAYKSGKDKYDTKTTNVKSFGFLDDEFLTELDRIVDQGENGGDNESIDLGMLLGANPEANNNPIEIEDDEEEEEDEIVLDEADDEIILEEDEDEPPPIIVPDDEPEAPSYTNYALEDDDGDNYNLNEDDGEGKLRGDLGDGVNGAQCANLEQLRELQAMLHSKKKK